jgi:hypothetical protein
MTVADSPELAGNFYKPFHHFNFPRLTKQDTRRTGSIKLPREEDSVALAVDLLLVSI